MSEPDPMARLRAGERNLITDVDGLQVGQADDDRLKSGTTVLTADRAFVAAVNVMGGAPGTRETDCLAPDRLVDAVHAIVLSGGSAFGLSAACGVADALRRRGTGFAVGPARVPIVPAAILFDLLNGGDKGWVENPYPALGRRALEEAATDFALGSVGAGCGATTGHLKGGLGSASLVLPGGATVGALVAANPHGRVCTDDGRFHAAPWEIDGEFGGRGVPQQYDPTRAPRSEKLEAFEAQAQTTIAVVATDVTLDKARLQRIAVAAQDGLARAIVPSHTPFDGDLVFAVSTGRRALDDTPSETMLLGHAAAHCLSRAIARAVYHATPTNNDILPTWSCRYG